MNLKPQTTKNIEDKTHELLDRLPFLPDRNRGVLVELVSHDPVALKLVELGVKLALDYGANNGIDSYLKEFNSFMGKTLATLPENIDFPTSENIQHKLTSLLINNPGCASQSGLENSLFNVKSLDELKHDHFAHMVLMPLREYAYHELLKSKSKQTKETRNVELREFSQDYSKLAGMSYEDMAYFLKATNHFMKETIASVPNSKTGKIDTNVIIDVKRSSPKDLQLHITVPKWSLFNPALDHLVDFIEEGVKNKTISKEVFDEFMSSSTKYSPIKRRTILTKKQMIMNTLYDYTGCIVSKFKRPESKNENEVSNGISASQMAGPASPYGRMMNISIGRRFLSDNDSWDSIEIAVRHKLMEESNYESDLIKQVDIESKITKEVQDILSDGLEYLRGVYKTKMDAIYTLYCSGVDPNTVDITSLKLINIDKKVKSIGKLFNDMEKEEALHLAELPGHRFEEQDLLNMIYKEYVAEMNDKINNLFAFEANGAKVIGQIREEFVEQAEKLINATDKVLPEIYSKQRDLWQNMVTNATKHCKISDLKKKAIDFSGMYLAQMTENLTKEMTFVTKIKYYNSLSSKK